MESCFDALNASLFGKGQVLLTEHARSGTTVRPFDDIRNERIRFFCLLIKPVERWDKSIGKYIKPVFLEIGAHGYGLKKEFNDDNEVQLFLHEMPKDIVNGSPEEFDNYVSVEEGTLTVKYEPEEVINFMYNEIYCEAQSIILNCLDDIYHKCNLERNQVERINKDNIIEVKPAMDANGNLTLLNFHPQLRKIFMRIMELLQVVM